MSALRLDGTGAGTGQPGRADFNGARHLDQLVSGHDLDIGDGGVHQPTNRTTTREERKLRSGWQRQESLVTDSGERRRQGGDNWNKFSGSGGRRQNLGHVAIDRPLNPLTDQPPKTFTPAQLKNGMWVVQAAQFEESQRATEGRYGAGEGVELPPIDVSDDVTQNGPGSPKNNRRAFRVG